MKCLATVTKCFLKQDILKMGGNAADAAVATMAVVSLLQPNTCGIGGDCHSLFFKKADKKIYAVNGRTVEEVEKMPH